jgi:hypothetical protein
VILALFRSEVLLVEIFGGLPDDMTLRMIAVYIFLLVAAIAHFAIWKTILWSGFFLVVASNLGQIFNFLNSAIIKLGVEPKYTFLVWIVLGIIFLAWILSSLGFTDRDIAVMTYLNILFK